MDHSKHEKMEASAVKKTFPGKFQSFKKAEKKEKETMKSSPKMKGGKY